MLVKRRLEPAVSQPATTHPLCREGFHLCHQSARLEIRCTEQLQWTRRAAPLGKSRAFQHHRSWVAPGHPEVGCVWAWIHPRALAERPTVPRFSRRLPTIHLHDLTLHVEPQLANKPTRELSQGEPVTHRQRSCTHKAFPTGPEPQPFHRTSSRIGPVEDPDCLAVLRSRFKNVTQSGDESVDPATDILEIDKQNVEAVHHRRRWPAHFPV